MMSSEKFKKEVTKYKPYLSDDYNYPKFKKGEVVWLLHDDTSLDAEYHVLKYNCDKVIITNGDPVNDDCGWYYRVCPLVVFECDDYNGEMDKFVEQTSLFSTLRELKEAVKYKCNKRIDKLKEKIELIEMQMEDIELEFDEQENRDDIITNILNDKG